MANNLTISSEDPSGTAVEFSVEKSTIEVLEDSSPITILEEVCTLTADNDITLVSAENLVVNLELLGITPNNLVINSVSNSIEVLSQEADIFEKCLQGPQGPQGLPGDGGSGFSSTVDVAQTEVVSSVDSNSFSSANWKVNIKNLVLNRQIFLNIHAIFLPGHDIRYNISGINRKDVINYTLSIVRNGNLVELTISNQMPSTLLVDGLLFPII